MTERCRKCGSESGWSGPKYGHRVDITYRSDQGMYAPGYPKFSEWLAFACNVCGFERQEATFDAPAPLPPAPDTDPGILLRAGPSWLSRLFRWRSA